MFLVSLVPDGDVMVFCRFCGQSTFLYDESVEGIVSVKQWMFNHIVQVHRIYRYATTFVYPMR